MQLPNSLLGSPTHPPPQGQQGRATGIPSQELKPRMNQCGVGLLQIPSNILHWAYMMGTRGEKQKTKNQPTYQVLTHHCQFINKPPAMHFLHCNAKRTYHAARVQQAASQQQGLTKRLLPFPLLSAPQNDPGKLGKSISKTLIHVKYYFLAPEIQSPAMKTKSTLINVPSNPANRALFRHTHKKKSLYSLI